MHKLVDFMHLRNFSLLLIIDRFANGTRSKDYLVFVLRR